MEYILAVLINRDASARLNFNRGGWEVVFAIKRVLLLLTLMPLFAAGCEFLPQPEPTVAFVPPPTATPAAGSLFTVRPGVIVDAVKVRGRVAATREAFLFFGREGWLKTLNIKPGDQVTEGSLIAELNDPELNRQVADAEYFVNKGTLDVFQARENRLERSRLVVERARANLQRIDAGLEAARISAAYRKTLKDRAYDSYVQVAWKENKETLDALNQLEEREMAYSEAAARLKTLEIDRQVTAVDVEILEKDLENARIQAATEEGNLAYRQRVLDLTRERLAETRIEAPFSGAILSVEAKLGDKINPFEPIGIMADPSHLQVEANVTEVDAAKVAEGMPVEITLDAFPQSKFKGKVVQVASKASMWQGKSVYKVMVDFDDSANVRAAVRMGADVSIASRTKTNTLVLPARAVYSDGIDRYVDLVSQQGRAEKTRVEIGISDGNQTEVLNGLKAGQVVKIP
ncbi:MAG: efflux RND transporter periplasmic adaptor subunit [Chloroflexi bacterium]|nr:efflux RND transporter periplasmic adaptor subunit [Chloroflexota bacterium]